MFNKKREIVAVDQAFERNQKAQKELLATLRRLNEELNSVKARLDFTHAG